MGLFISEKKLVKAEFQPYKQRKDLTVRRNEVTDIRTRHPDKIPIIVEKHSREKSLPHLSRSKFLAPSTLTIAQLLAIVRSRMHLSSTQTMFLFLNNRNLCSASQKLGQLYEANKDEDGFLYFNYASQEAFG